MKEARASLMEVLERGRVLISDGAWGTLLHARGLAAGECPEQWNLVRREDVKAIARSYVEAGADIILTNSFGASPFKLAHYGLAEKAAEINRAAAAISREAMGDAGWVLGSMGPTGVMLMMGEVSEPELLDGFKVQAEALHKGGVDAICIETMADLDEAVLAVRAAREVTDLPVACTFTFERTAQGNYRSMMGVSPGDMLAALKAAGASIVGSNCGNGFAQMAEIVRELRAGDASIPILVHANAGKPEYRDGQTVFPEGPEAMASMLDDLVKVGANIIGGCCGTTPAHIRALVKRLEMLA